MDEQKSKSQKKREAEALQKLGTQLVALQNSLLEQLPLSAALRQALREAKALKSHGAIRRHAQFIGKLMRSEAVEEIQQILDEQQLEERAQSQTFHELEQWRERLLLEGNQALAEFVALYRPHDVQHLRQLIKKAVEEQHREQSTGAGKALFRYLRSCVS